MFPRVLTNAAFLECLPIGIVIFDQAMDVVFLNSWMNERLGGRGAPARLKELASWGNGEWAKFTGGVPGVSSQARGNFALQIGEKGRMDLTVTVHRLKAPLDGATIMALSDVSELRATEEHLRETLAHVTELSDTMIAQSLELKHVNATLEERVRERTVDLRRANMDALRMLAVACEAKDHETSEHVERVRRYTELISRELGLEERQVIEFGYSSILHDVGKVQVPDAILTKPGPLTAEERAIMQQHAVAGDRILAGNAFFGVARRIAREHHENMDGSGYPDGLVGRAISVAARIVHVADVFDALTSVRPYKMAWPISQAMEQIEADSGRHFDADVVAALRSLVGRREIVARVA